MALAELTERVASLESDRQRFMDALKQAAVMTLKNPIAIGMMPKDMKQGLRDYLKREGIDL
jgi:hypothetical protein